MQKRTLNELQRGQGLAEYALVIALVALATAVILGLVALAANRNYGLIAGALGAKRDAPGSHNYIYFDNNAPRCGSWMGHNRLYMQFHSDIDPANLSATTENSSLTLPIDVNTGAFDAGGNPIPGIGNLLIEADVPDGTPCPISVVIQSDPAHGSLTVVWNVLHQDWG